MKKFKDMTEEEVLDFVEDLLLLVRCLRRIIRFDFDFSNKNNLSFFCGVMAGLMARQGAEKEKHIHALVEAEGKEGRP